MITAGFWKRKFGSASDAIGKSLTLDGRAYTIVGVVPANFDLLGTMRSRELYVPVGQWSNPILMNRAAGLGFHGIGRLKPGVTVAQARTDMERVARNLAETYPDSDKGIGAALIPAARAHTWTGRAISAAAFRRGGIRAVNRGGERRQSVGWRDRLVVRTNLPYAWL
jgi:hypothetical protein